MLPALHHADAAVKPVGRQSTRELFAAFVIRASGSVTTRKQRNILYLSISL